MQKNVKIIVSILITITIFLISTTVQAEEIYKVDMGLVAENMTIDLDKQKEVAIYLKLTDFNLPDKILGYEAVLNYDTNVFSKVTVTGLNDWIGISSNNDIYTESTKKLVSTTSNATVNTNVAKLVFTISETAKAQDTTITLNKLLIAAGNEESTQVEEKTKSITLHLEKKQQEPAPDEGENNKPNNEQKPDNKNEVTNAQKNEVANETVNQDRANITVTTPTDDTQANGKIPQTGANMQVLGAIVIIAILGIIIYIRYRSIEIK